MSVVDQVDQFIRLLGVNPYFVSVGLVITIAPVVWSILKGLWRGGVFAIGSIRQGYQNQKRSLIEDMVRRRLTKDDEGYLVAKEIVSFDIYIVLISAVIGFFFLMAGTAFVFIVGEMFLEIGGPIPAAFYLIVSSLTKASKFVRTWYEIELSRKIALEDGKRKLNNLDCLLQGLDRTTAELSEVNEREGSI